jgi:hypothetical protein
MRPVTTPITTVPRYHSQNPSPTRRNESELESRWTLSTPSETGLSPSTSKRPGPSSALSRESLTVARKPGAFKYQTSWDATVEIASFVLAELAGGEPHAPSTRAAKKTVPAEAILTH